ncbi:MAG: diaminopimelate epimerase, partial [Candidatus Omnitrophica bacterium]|nr:diaminopimelate epimerase [Candidatus Omnitrophota bacterium]
LVLDKSTVCNYRMRIINDDGSEAEMCGNGARCMASYIVHKFAVVPEVFTMETLAGSIQAMATGDMASVKLSDPKDYRPNMEIRLASQKMFGHFINTGVPHMVIFVQGLQEVDVNDLGRIIRHHQLFAPQGTNVNFVEQVKEGYLTVRTYERGVEAETLACGTGSVASALVGYLLGAEKPAPAKGVLIKVVPRSGEMLDVTFDLDIKEDKPVITNVWLKGSGKIICKGEYYYDGV